jgi:outer membrane autotransporter protein
MNNIVNGNGTVGQVGTGILTITNNGATAFAAFTGNFAATNGTLAFANVANLGRATGFNLASNGTLLVNTGVAALSQNISVTSGTGIVDNNTGSTLALNGTLAKTGSVLVLTGGNFQINGAIVGNSGSFNSDMVYDAATATINVPGVYFGPTFVQGGSTVTSGVANALPTDTVLNVGVATDGAVTNTFNLSTFDQTVAAITSAGSASNIITSTGGDLTVNGVQNTTYNGLITGSLALTRAGTGSTTLGGANTYSGGTTINAGRIITTSASALGTGAVVLNGGALQVMQTLQISSLNWASNSAVIVLPNAYGTNSYVNVAGAITLGNPSGNTFDLTGTALDGAPTKLLGSGVTALNATSFAATGVNPIYGYQLYTQGNDLWLQIISTNIEVSGPNSYTTINVNGAYTMGGVLKVTEKGGYSLQYGDQYMFLTATGGITGAYSSIDMPEKYRGRLLLGNNNTSANILVAPDTYTRVAITQNQKNVAKALDSFIPATSGDRKTVSLTLDLQTAGQYPYAFDQIAPGFYESLANIVIEQAFNQTQMLNQRISSVRLGAAGFQAIGGITQPLLNDKNGRRAADAKDASPIVESAISTSWNAWALGTGMFSRTTNLGSLQNYNNDAGGFLVGADYRWSENFVTGLYGGYDYSYAEYNGGGSAKGNSFSFGTYASYEKDGYYADAVIGGGYTGFQTQRSIQFSTIDRTASADPNSGQFTAGINLGKDFEVGKFTLGPIVGAQYTYAGIGSFTESGAESLNLSLGQENANSLRSTLGGRVAYTWNLNQKIALIPEVRMFWQHEFLNNPRTINASLDGGSSPSFGFETTDPYRNSVFAGAGVTAQFGERWNASLFYNVNFGSQTYQNNMVSAGLNFSF